MHLLAAKNGWLNELLYCQHEKSVMARPGGGLDEDSERVSLLKVCRHNELAWDEMRIPLTVDKAML